MSRPAILLKLGPPNIGCLAAMSPPPFHDLDDPVPQALRDAIARGWRGLTIVTGRDDGRPVTLVRAGEPASMGAAGGLRIGLCAGRHGPVPDRLALRLGDGDGMQLSLDLRLAGVRALVRSLAAAGRLVLADASGVPARRVSIAPAAEAMRLACARAGEWYADDPGGGLVPAMRWRLEADGSMPRLMSGARRGDPPVLAIPAGGRFDRGALPVKRHPMAHDRRGGARRGAPGHGIADRPRGAGGAARALRRAPPTGTNPATPPRRPGGGPPRSPCS